MMNIYPPYNGIEREIGFTGHLTGMLTRVFLPQRAPHRFEMFITKNTESGYLGRDVTFEFHKHIKTPNGKEVPRSEKDFYISPSIEPYKVTPPVVLSIMEFVLKKIFFFLKKESAPLFLPDMLPSYLFYGAKENDRVSFLYDDQPVELTLKQKNHPMKAGQKDFQEAFESIPKLIQYEIDKGYSPYLFMKDARKDELFLKKGDFCMKIGPDTVIKRFPYDVSSRVTEEMSTPATQEKVKELKKALNKANGFRRVETISDTTREIYSSWRTPSNFTAVVNGRHIMLISSAHTEQPHNNEFIMLRLEKPCNPDTLQCARDLHCGMARFTFDYLPVEAQS